MSKEQLSPQDLADIEEARAAYQEYLKSMAPPEQEKSIKDQAIEAGLTGLDYAGRGLDWAGGLARTGAAAAIDPFVEAELVKSEDIMKALEGQAPGTAEYLERAGSGDLGSVDLPLVGKVTGRDVAGFAGDVLLDPLTYVSFGTAPAIRAAGKAGKIAEKAGKGIYKSAPMMQALDKQAIKMNKKFADNIVSKPSEILMEAGISGTNENIAKKSGDLMDTLLTKRDEILKQADEAGAVVDPNEAMRYLDAKKSEYIGGKNPYKKQAAEKVSEQVFDYRQLEALTPSEMAEINADFYTKFKDAYRKGDVGKIEDTLIKQQGYGTKKAIENSVEKVLPGMGQELAKTNADLSALLTVQKKLASEGSKQGKKMITEVDAIVGSFNPWAAVAKKGAALTMSDFGRTKAGQGIRKLGLGAEDLSKKLTEGSFGQKALGAGLEGAARQGLWIDMLRQEQEKQK